MSDTELHIGKVKQVSLQGEPLLDAMFRLAKLNGFEFDPEDDDIDDQFRDEYSYDTYVITKDVIYEIIEDEELDASDAYCNLTPNDDGTISFSSSFYNGGTCLSEMLEDALENYKTK